MRSTILTLFSLTALASAQAASGYQPSGNINPTGSAYLSVSSQLSSISSQVSSIMSSATKAESSVSMALATASGASASSSLSSKLQSITGAATSTLAMVGSSANAVQPTTHNAAMPTRAPDYMAALGVAVVAVGMI